MSDSKDGNDVYPTRILGKVTVDNINKTWDAISGRYVSDSSAGDYVHRQIRGAVTNPSVNTTTDLGNFTAGSRDEVFVDFEAFYGAGDAGINADAPAVRGFVIIDQAGTILREFYLDADEGSTKRVHVTSTSQHSPIFRIQAGTVCNIKHVNVGSIAVNATVHVSFSGNRLAFAGVTAPVGII